MAICEAREIEIEISCKVDDILSTNFSDSFDKQLENSIAICICLLFTRDQIDEKSVN